MRIILLMCLFAAGVMAQMPKIESGVSQELAKWRAVQYSNISYKLNLTLEKMSPVLKGSIEIHVTQAAYACAEPNCPPMYIVLDWRKIPGHEKDSTINNVTINGTNASVIAEPPPGTNISTGGNPQPLPRSADMGRLMKLYPPPDPRPTPTVTGVERSDHLIFHDGVKMGENVIKLDFTSPILTSGSAITRYIDKEDGSEYIYSLFVPSDASTAFPCFDQPDLKARFTVNVSAPEDWRVISNGGELQTSITSTPDRKLPMSHPPISLLAIDGTRPAAPAKVAETPTQAPRSYSRFFAETQPISTYVFAFAAGPWKEFTDAGTAGGNPSGSEGAQRGTPSSLRTLPTGRVSASAGQQPRNIYVRASQAKKFEPHFKDVARLRDEGVKYLETYFDYKFPFPKLDLVLIPEFPFGGMEHAGAIFLREDRVIFPAEPTKGDYLTRANLIFHETAHQWFGDTVTMKWFDDLWLKEGFAEFMAYKTLEKVMPDANAWKVFYERNKQAAYATDSTRGTTPIYQKIDNLSAAKSAYGNIVYRKAPSFLRQAEFYLGEDKFQTAVRAFLKKHEFGNAGWEDLVREFEAAPGGNEDVSGLDSWATAWIKRPGLTIVNTLTDSSAPKFWGDIRNSNDIQLVQFQPRQSSPTNDPAMPFTLAFRLFVILEDGTKEFRTTDLAASSSINTVLLHVKPRIRFAFPNYQDYGYGIFLLDDKSRDYVLKHIGEEKDPFLRSMMWGALWDSVREAELDPREYVELAIKNLPTESDETIVSSILSRVSTAMSYYLSEPPASAGGQLRGTRSTNWPPAHAGGSDLTARFEPVLLDRLQHAPTAGQRITFYRAYVANASTPKAREVLKQMLAARQQHTQAGSLRSDMALRTKDKFDIVTRLIILGDPEAPKLLANLEKTETSDDAKRYAYAAHAAFATPETKAKFFNDFLSNKDISESWIESAAVPFNSITQAELTQPYLARALAELPNLKRTRKIFFVNDWLAAWIGGQRDQKALDIINKFLADNPQLDNDLRLKILENIDLIERAVKIRSKFSTKD